MLSRAEIADLAIEQVAGGAPPDRHKWHPKVVRPYVDVVLSEAISKILQRAEKEGNNGVDPAWIKAFNNVKVKWDGNRKQCYALFPAKIIVLSGSKGLREVRWLDESVASEAFRIIDPMAYPVISNLECSILSTGVYHVSIEGDKMYFPDMPQNMATMNAKVRVKMICGSDGFKDNEPLPLPDELAATVVDKVVQYMTGQKMTRQKMSNDSNPNNN